MVIDISHAGVKQDGYDKNGSEKEAQ